MLTPFREKRECSHVFEPVQFKIIITLANASFWYSEMLVESMAKCTSLRNSVHASWAFKKLIPWKMKPCSGLFFPDSRKFNILGMNKMVLMRKFTPFKVQCQYTFKKDS